MKFNRYFFLWVFLAIALFFQFSCTKPFVGACRELARNPKGEWRYTEEQAKAACAYANRYIAGSYDSEKAYWSIDYTNILTTKEVLAYIQDQLKSLDVLLSYQIDGLVRDVDFWKGLREGFEAQEKRLRWIEHRLTYVVNYNEFVDKVGESSHDVVKKLMPHGRHAYSLRLLYPIYNLKQLHFKADYIEAAKEEGSLKLINTFPIVEMKKYGKKIIDKDDSNKFIWKEHYRGWLIKGYKILPDSEQPLDSNIDYLEVYRAKFKKTKDGKNFDSYEDHFAVAGFKSKGNETVNLFVVDYDLNALEGFSPDQVLEVYLGVAFGDELHTSAHLKKEILDVLYEPPIGKKKEYRKKPLKKALYVEVARQGEVDIELWEQNDDGFEIPFSYSAQGPGKFDMTVEIIWKKPKNGEKCPHGSKSNLKQIERFKVMYRKSKNVRANVKVIEYHSPKDEYSKKNIKDGIAYSDTIRLRRKGKPQEEADIGYFSKRITAIDYEYGSRWYRIVDKDGDNVFERRRKIADPTEQKRQVFRRHEYNYGY